MPQVGHVHANLVRAAGVQLDLQARRHPEPLDHAPSGAGGDAGGAVGAATIVDDSPEHVVVRVEAPAPGFLLLADQYYPGWRATVNGVAQEILRSNHTFRLVTVPAGISDVVFTFRPGSVALGAGLSLFGLLLAAALWAVPGGRRGS